MQYFFLYYNSTWRILGRHFTKVFWDTSAGEGLDCAHQYVMKQFLFSLESFGFSCLRTMRSRHMLLRDRPKKTIVQSMQGMQEAKPTYAQQLWVRVPLYLWSDISLSRSCNCYILDFGEDQVISEQSKRVF